MIRLSLNLPNRLRLDLRLVRRRRVDDVSIFPNLDKIRRIRSGNKISRFFRHILEHKNIKKNFGINLAILVALSSFIRPENPFMDIIQESTVVSAPLVINTEKSVQHPVEKIKITQGYKFYHPGIDLDGKTGDDIKPIMAGQVESTSYSKVGYGNAILLNHGSGILSLYAHLSQILVKKGDFVTNQTVIGKMGATGRAFGDHLHLEVYEGGKPINPLTLLPK